MLPMSRKVVESSTIASRCVAVSHSEMPKPAKPSDAAMRMQGRGEIDTSSESAPSQQPVLLSPSFASSQCRISKQMHASRAARKCLTPGF